MGHRPFNDPLSGSPTGQIDRLLGSSYEVVRHVSMFIQEICKVSRHMHDVRTVANEVFRTRMVTATAPALGGSVSLALPTAITTLNVRAFNVVLVAATGEMYPLGDPAFTARVSAGNLVVDIDPAAPAPVAGSEIRWTISYKGDLHEPQ